MTRIYMTKFFMVGSFALDNHENVDVNAGKVGRYRQLVIKTDTICEKNRQQSWQMSTLKKWFTQIRELFSMINQTNTKIKPAETSRQLVNKTEYCPARLKQNGATRLNPPAP